MCCKLLRQALKLSSTAARAVASRRGGGNRGIGVLFKLHSIAVPFQLLPTNFSMSAVAYLKLHFIKRKTFSKIIKNLFGVKTFALFTYLKKKSFVIGMCTELFGLTITNV